MVIHHQRRRPAANPCSVPGDCDSSALQRPSSSNRKPHKGVDRQSAEQTAAEYQSQTRLIAAHRITPQKESRSQVSGRAGAAVKSRKAPESKTTASAPKRLTTGNGSGKPSWTCGKAGPFSTLQRHISHAYAAQSRKTQARQRRLSTSFQLNCFRFEARSPAVIRADAA